MSDAHPLLVAAPGPFKGALGAGDAAAALAGGLAEGCPGATVRQVPVADGGQGTMQALVQAAGGHTLTRVVGDPLGRPVSAQIGWLPGEVAVIDLAAASGYERLSDPERDPEATSTVGTGELIRAALDAGARRVLVGVGGSATCDGGLGLAIALGARALDDAGRELPGTGGALGAVARIDLAGLDPRLGSVPIEVLCDVRNPMVGPNGAAAVFGPQKGASPAAVARLDAGLARLARAVAERRGVDVSQVSMGGAAGGAAGGLLGMLGATLRPGADVVLDVVGLRAQLAGAALCVTGEGALDSQSAEGKAPSAVAALCAEVGVPCVAVCGRLDADRAALDEMGFVAALPINPEPLVLTLALTQSSERLHAVGVAIGAAAGSGELVRRLRQMSGSPPTG